MLTLEATESYMQPLQRHFCTTSSLEKPTLMPWVGMHHSFSKQNVLIELCSTLTILTSPPAELVRIPCWSWGEALQLRGGRGVVFRLHRQLHLQRLPLGTAEALRLDALGVSCADLFMLYVWKWKMDAQTHSQKITWCLVVLKIMGKYFPFFPQNLFPKLSQQQVRPKVRNGNRCLL